MIGPRAVFLVGFMGVGKSTAGRALARILGWDFVDLDERIVEREGRGVASIFAEAGERYFRRVEGEVLAALRGRERMVVACGGGTYALREHRVLIDSMGAAIWIQLPIEEALRRCGAGADRPMFRGPAEARALYERRLPSYRAARLQVDAEGLAPEQVAERIAALLVPGGPA